MLISTNFEWVWGDVINLKKSVTFIVPSLLALKRIKPK